MEEARKQNEEMAIMFDWFNREGYEADIPHLRQSYPQLKTLATWFRQNMWTEADLRSGAVSSQKKE